jgi:hypothetical protein
MSEYELRLLNDRRQTVKIYKMACLNDACADATLNGMRDISYSYYEMWKGMQKIGEGPRPISPVLPDNDSG